MNTKHIKLSYSHNSSTGYGAIHIDFMRRDTAICNTHLLHVPKHRLNIDYRDTEEKYKVKPAVMAI